MGFSKADLFTVDQITSRTTLVVPEFQRGYAWQTEHWNALWDDVTSVVERDAAQHYTGAIMITDAPEGEPSELIDGQQRMVTIALLISALGEPAYAITFRNNEVLQNSYDLHALKREVLSAAVARDRSYYARNLTAAYEYFQGRAASLPDDAARAAYVSALRSRLKLFVLTIRPEFDIHVAFETINNRGRPLSTLEKLKNRLIYLASQDSDSRRSKQTIDEIHRCWKEVYASLGAGDQLLGDDDFLAAHASGWFRVERVAGWLSIKLFDEEFSTKRSADSAKILTYVRSLEQAAACWHLVNEPRRLPPVVAERLHALYRTAHGASKPVLLWALIRTVKEHRKLLSQPAVDTGWADAFAALAWEAERFGVLAIQASARPAHTGKSDFSLTAHALAVPGTRVVTSNPELTSPQDTSQGLALAGRHIRSLVDNLRASDVDGVATYADASFQWPGYFSAEHVQAAVNDRFNKKKGDGFYGWPFGKLVVLAWEDRLRGKRGSPDRRPWEKFHWSDSVEHIYPQTPEGDWENSINVGGRSRAQVAASIAGSLGNLLMLSGSFNSELSNRPFYSSDGKDKVSRYSHGSYSEQQIVHICDKWTIVEIAARGIAMLRHAQKHWDFELLPDDADVAEWLPYLFGPLAERVRRGEFYYDVKLDGRNVGKLVEKFNQPLVMASGGTTPRTGFKT